MGIPLAVMLAPKSNLGYCPVKASMKESSFGVKLAISVGFFMSAGALYWLVASPPRSHELLFRIGYASAVVCALAVLSFCWAAFVADLALKRHWSPPTCLRAGWPFILLALIACVAGSQFWRAAALLAANAVFVGLLCRRLVYPHLTDEEATADPPLRLVQK